MKTRQTVALLLLGVVAMVSAEDVSSDYEERDVEKRGGGRAFVGGYDSYYPTSKRLSDFYNIYHKRGGGRQMYGFAPEDFEKRGGGRAIAAPVKRGGGRAFFDDKRGGGRAFYDENKRGGGRAFVDKRGGGRAFVGHWAAYPRLERRGGGRSFGDYATYF